MLFKFLLMMLLLNSPHSISQLKVHRSEFVTSYEGELYSDGKVLKAVGLNRYNLLSVKGSECGDKFSDLQLEEWFTQAEVKKMKVVRFWAFPLFTAQGTNWERFDKVVALADQHQILLIPTLENHWSDCSDQVKNSDWYKDRYKLSDEGEISFSEYAAKVVSRYSESKQILAWDIVNEPEIAGSDGNEALAKFTNDMVKIIKKEDHNHLVMLGTIGTGQPGSVYRDWQTLLTDVDLASYHDYPLLSNELHQPDNPMPGDRWNGLLSRFSMANRVKVPVIMGEAGINVGQDVESHWQRAEYLRSKIKTFFLNGGDVYLIWSGQDAKPRPDGFDVNWDDVLFEQITLPEP